MPIQTATKATVPVGSDPYAPTADMKRLSETTRSVISISSPGERAGLPALFPGGVLPIPTVIARMDLGGAFQLWDGTNWLTPSLRKHAEFTVTANPTGGANWGPTVPVVDPDRTFNNSFVVPDGASRLKLTEVGVFSVKVKYGSGAAPGVFYASIKNSTDTEVYADNSSDGATWGVTVSDTGILAVTANTGILLGLKTGNTVNVTGRVVVDKISD